MLADTEYHWFIYLLTENVQRTENPCCCRQSFTRVHWVLSSTDSGSGTVGDAAVSGVRSQETGRSSLRSRIATGLIWFLCLSDSLQPRSRFPFMFLKSENLTKCGQISLLTSEFENNCLTERCLSNDLLLRLICCSRIFSDHNRWSRLKLSCHGIIVVYFCYSPMAFMLPKCLKNSKHLKHASNNSNKVQ